MFSIIEELESGDESQPTSLSKNMKKQVKFYKTYILIIQDIYAAYFHHPDK